MKVLFCYLEHLDSLRLGHADCLMSWVGLYVHRNEVEVQCGFPNMCHGVRQVEWKYNSTAS